MTTTPLTQENQPTPKPKRKKLKLLGVGVFFLLVSAVPILYFLGPFEEDLKPNEPIFYVSRDGVLFDLSTSDPLIVRMAVTNSADTGWGITSFNKRVLNNSITTSGSFVTRLEDYERCVVEDCQYEKLSDFELQRSFQYGSLNSSSYRTFTVDTLDLVSEKVLSSEKLFDYKITDCFVVVRCVLSEDKLLFERGSGAKEERDAFWCVKSDDQWTTIPLDFGIQERVWVQTFEIVREKQSILFLLTSENEDKAYVASYNYQSFSVEKVIELPSDFLPFNTCLRVLSGAQHFSVCQRGCMRNADAAKCIIFSTTDLTKVKEIAVPITKDRLTPRLFVISPDLRYVAHGYKRFCLYDVDLQQEFYLRSDRPTFFQHLFSDCCQKLYDFDYRCKDPLDLIERAKVYSFGFTEDSRLLIVADLLGNVYRWDVQSKKKELKIVNSKY